MTYFQKFLYIMHCIRLQRLQIDITDNWRRLFILLWYTQTCENNLIQRNFCCFFSVTEIDLDFQCLLSPYFGNNYTITQVLHKTSIIKETLQLLSKLESNTHLMIYTFSHIKFSLKKTLWLIILSLNKFSIIANK